MTQVIEAVYTQGILKPVDALALEEQQRVRLIVEPLQQAAAVDRAQALAQLRAGIAGMNFHMTGRPPTRDELHERT